MPRIPNQTTSIVQAAHIHQHAISVNDDPRNGLALTPDAHLISHDATPEQAAALTPARIAAERPARLKAEEVA